VKVVGGDGYFCVLGAVRVWRAQDEIDLGSPQQRALFALLVVLGDRPAGVAEIVDVLWGGAAPPSAIGVVQHYVSRLRRVLAASTTPGGPVVSIQRTPSGYRLERSPGTSDLEGFRQAVEHGRRSAAADDPELAVAQVVQGLGLWSGPIATGLPAGVREHPVFQQVQAEWATALRWVSDLALRTQSVTAAELVCPLLERGVQADPLDESLLARLMLVHGAGGRRAGGLELYTQARARLLQELGVEPGPEMRAAHQALLRTVTGHHRPEPEADVTVRPAQLPRSLNSFAGRRDELGWLNGQTEHPSMLAVVSGMGGVGKSSLVLRWAHTVVGSYPDGQLYVDLRGFGPGGSAPQTSEVLRGFLTAIGMPAQRLPAGLEDLIALFRSTLNGRKMLLLLDNARSAEQVRPYLPGAAGCAVVITSRSMLTDLVTIEGAQVLALDVLAPDQARRYLRERFGAQRVGPTAAGLEDLAQLCGGLPLALAIVGAWASTHPTFAPAVIAEELREASGLDKFELAGAERGLRATFSWSYRNLSPAAAQLFRALSLHPGPDLTLPVVISLGATDASTARRLLGQLADAHLLQAYRPGRYRLHDLVRLYALELTQQQDPAPTREAMVVRVLDHYLHTAMTAAVLIYPASRTLDDVPLAEGVVPVTLPDRRAAIVWLDAERSNVFAAVDEARARGLDPYLWRFSWTLDAYLQDIRYLTAEKTRLTRFGLEAALRHDQQWWVGCMHSSLGRTLLRLNQAEPARLEFEQALAVGLATNDPERTANSLLGISYSYVVLGLVPTPEQARLSQPFAARAREIFSQVDTPFSRVGEASCLELLGWHAFHQPSGHDQALDLFRTSIEINRRAGMRISEAAGWETIARFHQHSGDGPSAVTAYVLALELFGELDDSRVEAVVGLAVSYRMVGDLRAAEETRTEAVRLIKGTGHPEPERLFALLGHA
jgi:DNA-binding SARP family transcriptional activator/tetratricopeptide (TPR) repeat protein